MRDSGGAATFVRADIARAEDVRRIFDVAIEEYGALHVLYNNASVFFPDGDGPVTEISEDVWERVLAVNLRGLFLCCKYGIPLIAGHGGWFRDYNLVECGRDGDSWMRRIHGIKGRDYRAHAQHGG